MRQAFLVRLLRVVLFIPPYSRKREARQSHKNSAYTQKLFGLKAKLHHAKRHSEKVQLKKTLKAHDERNVKQKDDGAVPEGALPTYLLDREGQKVCVVSCQRPRLALLVGADISLALRWHLDLPDGQELPLN